MKKLLIILLLLPTTSFAIELSIPIDCKIGKECFIQNYVDTESSNGWADYNCGNLSYNKHKGTDFRLRNIAAMNKGTNVLSAADGKIIGIRNNMQDINIKKINKHKIKGNECGNGVIIQHDDKGKWITQYCHMKQGSIVVKQGDNIKAGQQIGQVGLSGNTEFPHLHFSVRKDGKELDPFTGKYIEGGCKSSAQEKSLWKLKPPYNTSIILDYGITGTIPNAEKAREGKYHEHILNTHAKTLIIWADIMAPQKGDVMNVAITFPNGKKRNLKATFNKSQAIRFQFVGLKLKEKSWEKGEYKVTISTLHKTKGNSIKLSDRKSFEFTVK